LIKEIKTQNLKYKRECNK